MTTPQIKFRIPRDHPLADELLRLSKLLATSYQTPESITVHRISVVPPDVAEVEMLNLLRKIVGDSAVDEAVALAGPSGFSTAQLLQNLKVPGLEVTGA